MIGKEGNSLPPAIVIVEDSYFKQNRSPVYKIEINPFAPGDILYNLGVEPERIKGFRVRVSFGLNPRDPHQITKFLDPDEIVLYPSAVWNSVQAALASAELINDGSALIGRIGHLEGSNENPIYKPIRLGNVLEERARLARDLKGLVDKRGGERFFQLIEEGVNSDSLKDFLSPHVNQLFVRSLAKELYLVANPDQRGLNRFEQILYSTSPWWVSILAAHALREYWVLPPEGMLNTAGIVVVALGLGKLVDNLVPLIAPKFNVGSLRAEKFASEISKNPRTNGLVKMQILN